MWDSGGARYENISRGIADSIEHRVFRLAPQRGERVLDLATGTGWTSRVVARRGAHVTGVDIGADLIAAAEERAKAEGLTITYRVGDAASDDGVFDAVISTCGVRRSTDEAAKGLLRRLLLLRLGAVSADPEGVGRRRLNVLLQ